MNAAGMRPRQKRIRRGGACALAALALAAWLGCAGGSDPSTGDTTGSPSSTSQPPSPTSTRPAFDASFPDEDGGGVPDAGPDGSTTCSDPNDVGGSEPTAKDLGTITDSDSAGSTFSGVVSGAVDVDYYELTGTDEYGAVVDPTLSSTSTGVEICMFVTCIQGSGIDFKSCTGGSQATSDLGRPGCCFTAPGSIALEYDCLGTTNESATMFMRVRQTSSACVSYAASYHF